MDNVRLFDVIEVVGGGTPKRSVSKYWEGDIDWLSVKDFNNDGRYVHHAEEQITEAGLKSSSTKLLLRGDLIISARGTVGCLAQLTKPMAFNQSCYGIRGKEELKNDFLYYLLNTKILELQRNSHGAVFDTITTDTFKILSVSLPTLTEQKAIASVLGALDDKIENNRRMNKTLEEMARAIFKSWFVDFDPVHAKAAGKQPAYMDADTAALFPSTFGEDRLPTGWSKENLYNIASFINGAAYKNMHFCERLDGRPVIKIVELKQGISSQTKYTNTDLGEKYRIASGDIFFAWSGSPQTSINTFIWAGGDGWLNQHIFAIRENGFASEASLYFQMKALNPQFIKIAMDKQTTGLGHVTVKDMKEMAIVSSPNPLKNQFDLIAKPIFEKMKCNLFENQTLADLRDTLLPKLMSGEIRVKDAAEQIGEVT